MEQQGRAPVRAHQGIRKEERALHQARQTDRGGNREQGARKRGENEEGILPEILQEEVSAFGGVIPSVARDLGVKGARWSIFEPPPSQVPRYARDDTPLY